MKYKIEIGDKFNRLEVIGKIIAHHVMCRCTCGQEKLIAIRYLVNNRTVSCGCYAKEKAAQINLSHQLCSHKLYKIFTCMKRRCYEKTRDNYKYYGGRGIIICQEWLDNFINFYNWAIINGWKEGLTIERKDVNGNYCPENCKWIPQSEQGKNIRNNMWITAFGETKILEDWSRDNRCEIENATLWQRIKNKETPELAMKSRRKNENN